MARPTKLFSDYLIIFEEKHADKYTYHEDTYINSITEMKMICPIHGEFWQKPSNHANGKGCKKCGLVSMKNKLIYSNTEITHLLENTHDYKFDISTYDGTKKEMKFFCTIHGEFWQKPMNQMRQGAGCPKCSTTKAEKELIGLYPLFKHRDRDLIDPLEIDLINYQNKFGIEYNGNIWHSFGKTFPNNANEIIKNKHLDKTNLMEEKEYQLFHILDIDWNNTIKKEIWLSVINSKLGKTNRIYARKTKVVDLTNNREFVKDYLINNHLQGYQNYKYAYGLEYDGCIYSIMTFSKPTEDSSEWELKRFCNFRNTTIIGGASKLLKYFERTHNPKSLISYAKRDWSQGNLYEKIGFEFIENTEPSKFFIKNNIKYNRQKFQKHKLPKLFEQGFLKTLEGSTAQEIMFNNGFRIYYDSGNKKYKKIYKENK